MLAKVAGACGARRVLAEIGEREIVSAVGAVYPPSTALFWRMRSSRAISYADLSIVSTAALELAIVNSLKGVV